MLYSLYLTLDPEEGRLVQLCFLFSTFTWVLLMRTASLTSLIRHSLVLAVTLASYLASSPWCNSVWCLAMKDVAVPALYLDRCSLDLV